MVTPEQKVVHKRDALGFFWRALATAAAVQLAAAITVPHPDAILVLNTVTCAAFLARFSIGNYNYALSVFSVAAEWIRAEDAERRIRARFAWDSVLFAIHLSALLWMSREVGNAHLFRLAVLLLLLSDLVYLAFDRHAFPEWFLLLCAALDARKVGHQVTFVCNWPRHYTPRTWLQINASTAFFVFILEIGAHRFSIQDRRAAICLTSICAVNSVLDILLTKLEVSA